MRIVLIAFWCLWAAALPSRLFAQSSYSERPNAVNSPTSDSLRSLDTIRFSVGPGSILTSRNVEGWTADPGVGFAIQAPVLLSMRSLEGEVGVGAFAVPWTTTNPSRPDFLSIHMFIQGAVSSPSHYPVKLSAGLSAGNYFMSFSSNQVAGERNESELAVAVFSQIRRTFFRQLEGFAELRVTRVYTRPKLDFVEAKIGLSITVKAPNWLRTIAQ